MISWDCDKGNCHNRQIDGNWDDHDDWDMPCDSGPVRVALTKSSGRITDLRVYVGGEWRANTPATDLGMVSTKDAATYLLALALKDESRASEKAIFPAVLADSVTIWPDLLKVAKHGKGENVYLVRFHYVPPSSKVPVPRMRARRRAATSSVAVRRNRRIRFG